MTSENVIKLLLNIQHSAEPYTKGEIFDNTMYLCYLHLYQQHNPLNEIFEIKSYQDELLKTFQLISKHPDIMKFPKNYLQQIHLLDLDKALHISRYSKQLINIIDFNLHDYYVENLNTKKFEMIDFKTMKHLYYYYKNRNGVGFKNGSVKHKNNTIELIDYYKKNKPNDILRLLDPSELPFSSYKSLPNYTMISIFDDFPETHFFEKFTESVTQVKIDTYSFEMLFTNDYNYMSKIFNYLTSKIDNSFTVNHQDIKQLNDLFYSFQNYLEPEISNRINKTFDLTIEKLINNENPEFTTPHFILNRAALKSFEVYDIINHKYPKDEYSYKFGQNSIKNCLYDNLYHDFNYFNTITIYDNLKNNVSINDLTPMEEYHYNILPTYNNLAKLSPLIINFLRKNSPQIEDFELFFNVIGQFHLNHFLKKSHTLNKKAVLDYLTYKSDADNNIFSFISEYIRNEPIYIQTYFSDILKESIGDYPSSDNNFINHLKEYYKHLHEYEMDQAQKDIIALETHILENTISKNQNTKDKKIKF